jgi:hypothetical protein
MKPLLFAILLATLCGCGGYGAKVGGKVTLNGQPLGRGVVSYYPSGGGAAATGSIGADGSYTISTGNDEGVKPGEYTVTVFANEAPKTGTITEEIPKQLTPAVYADKATSPLKHTIKRGENTIDLPLTGEPPK